MSELITPKDYSPVISPLETQRAIKKIKDYFQQELAYGLNLRRVSAPLIVFPETGLNDNLSGVERRVSFSLKDLDDKEVEVVQSLAKWKRMALGKYGIKPGHGIYTDMNALRRDEELDNIHSIYVDQWDWEKVITKDQRTTEYLHEVVTTIYNAVKNLGDYVNRLYRDIQTELPNEIYFITTQELEDLYPNKTPKEREDLICKAHGAVFIEKIGCTLNSGEKHDGRSPDYDDWELNGDIILWNDVLDRAFEISSMGIRVDAEAMDRQLTLSGCDDRRSASFHQAILNDELPYSIGGGIGQSRLCMFFLRKAHIGEVQVCVWPDEMIEECKKEQYFHTVEMNYINVVIDNNSRHTDTFYTYAAKQDIKKGDMVKVPFNRGNKEKTAFVFETEVTLDCDPSIIKEIISVDSEISLTEEITETCLWMKKRYGIKYLDAVKCFAPNGKPAKEGKEKEPYKGEIGEAQNIERLTDEQAAAIGRITMAIKLNRQKNFLLHGVTGSGKTEVYMQVISETLKQGKTAIMLVPEIALTKQITDRFIGRFGKENIAVLHSKLTKRERFDEWMRIRRGQAKIVIGARMGVFAPLENIGIIIMDEEHEATYKSDMTPKYETVDIALKRLMHYHGVLLMGSATPSVVSYQRAQSGIYELIELKQRYNSRPLPKVELIDMREELKEGNRTIFSDRLYRKMDDTLKRGQQIILFLNRRGYSTFISCRECGEVMKCSECGITLTYHKRENAGICHYCGRKFPIPPVCPSCGSKYLKHFGTGTEKVEEFTAELFPDYTVSRLDLDTAKNQREINHIISDFSKGKTDILIGTQLVAKGLDFKNVGLVGVVAADVSLNIPDYRSTERTFQLVTQVAGRAGRGDEEGLVIVQSYTPDNFALTTAANHDYKAFYETEIKVREFMDYPPFSDLILVEFTSESEREAVETAENCKEYLIRCKIKEGSEHIFSPKISSNFKGKDSFRYYILIKCPKGLRNKYIYAINLFGENLVKQRSKCNLTIDVNPYSIF